MLPVHRYKVGLLLLATTLIFVFQNCSKFEAFDADLGFSENMASLHSGGNSPSSEFVDVGGISIKNKFGYIDGPVHGGSFAGQHQSRYNKIDQDVAPGLRIYNYWWASTEYSAAPGENRPYWGSKNPHECPSGFELYPSREMGLGKFHFYRCVNKNEMAKFKEIFNHDIQKGVLPIVTMYGTPLQYRGSDCQVSNEGFLNIRGVNVHPWGCPPVNLEHFEDYVRVLAKELGFIKHWNIWNENNADGWFHMSPEIRDSRTVYMSKMMKIVDKVFREENLRDYRMYLSLDMLWMTSHDSYSMSVKNFLDGIWAEVGTSVPWSLNLHPYTDEQARNPSGFPVDDRYNLQQYYGFGTLSRVLDYQKQKLQNLGEGSTTAPQLFALLGEQGWYMNDSNKRNIAIEICKAQDIMVQNPYIIGATYNTLFVQGTGDQNGLGLLPMSAINNFDRVDSEVTYQAMRSTHPSRWNKTRDHFCCTDVRVGCAQANTSPAPPEPKINPTPTLPDTGGVDMQTHNIYRYVNISVMGHVFVKAATPPSSVFVSEGIGYSLYSNAGQERMPIYRCDVGMNGREFQTTLSNCEGYRVLEILGYVHKSQGRPLYRCHHPAGGHLITTNKLECEASRYSIEGILGFVPN